MMRSAMTMKMKRKNKILLSLPPHPLMTKMAKKNKSSMKNKNKMRISYFRTNLTTLIQTKKNPVMMNYNKTTIIRKFKTFYDNFQTLNKTE